MVTDPQPVTPPEPQGRWQGLAVVRLVKLFGSECIRSLDPFYQPPNGQRPEGAEGSAVGIGSSGIKLGYESGHNLGFTTLAARAIAAYANLPPEISQALGYLANLVAAGQAASDPFRDCPETASAVLASKVTTLPPRHGGTEKSQDPCFCDCGTPWEKEIPEPDTQSENAPDKTPENTEDKTGKNSRVRRQKSDRSVTARLPASQLPNASLALGALAGLCAVGASSASDSNHWRNVTNAEDLVNICNNKNPCDGNYRLINNINVSHWTPIGTGGRRPRSFKGRLDGYGFNISNLNDCLVNHLGGKGQIYNLTLSKANINSNGPAGVVACQMSKKAIISNIRVKSSNVTTKGDQSSAGIAAGTNEGTVKYITAENCHVTTKGDQSNAGIAAGTNEGTVKYITAENCHVKTGGSKAYAGIGAGYNVNGRVINTAAVDCTVNTDNKEAYAGIGAGYNDNGEVINTTAVDCTVNTDKEVAHAGIGAGDNYLGKVINTLAVKNCTVETTGKGAHAGIGVGKNSRGSVDKTTAANCTVKTSGGYYGDDPHVGIGAGKNEKPGTTHITKVINSTIQGKKPCINVPRKEINDRCEDIKGRDKPVICNLKINNQSMPNSTKNDCSALCNEVREKISSLKIKNLALPNCPAEQSTDTPTTSSNRTLSGPGSANTTTPITPTPVPGNNTTFSAPGSPVTPTPATVTTLSSNSTTPGFTPFAAPTTPAAPLSPAILACIALGTGVVLLFGLAGACFYHHRRQKSLTRAGVTQPMADLFGSLSWTAISTPAISTLPISENSSQDLTGRTTPAISTLSLSENSSQDPTGRTTPAISTPSMSEKDNLSRVDQKTPVFSHEHSPLLRVNQEISDSYISMVTFGKEPDQPLYSNQPYTPEYDQGIHPLMQREQAGMEPWYSKSTTNIEEDSDQPVLLNELRTRDNFMDYERTTF